MKKNFEWWAEVIRDGDLPRGPGTLSLYRGDVLQGEYACFTGGEKLDPHQLGGLTPPIRWRMVEPIKRRKHPQGHSMTMARIYPVQTLAIEDFQHRTFSLTEWPFMVHKAGRSTGCIAIVPEDWEDAMEALNRAFEEEGEGFEIDVD